MDQTVIMVYIRQKGPEPLAPLLLLAIKLALNKLTVPHVTILRLLAAIATLYCIELHCIPHDVLLWWTTCAHSFLLSFTGMHCSVP